MPDKKGFTLVELSIVLVIIGLLIGGILAAQSMISTTKINAVAMQIGQFDAGVENFKTKYNALPGDAKSFGGNGDGLIVGGTGGTGSDDRYYSCEMASFWYDIDQQQYPSGNVTCGAAGLPATMNGANKNVPESKLGKPGSFFIAEASSGVTTNFIADVSNPQNYYAILSGSQLQQPYTAGLYFLLSTTAAANNSAVKPADAFAFDKKIDDGLANSGNVLAGSISTNPANTAIDVGSIHTTPMSDTLCTTTQLSASYNLTNQNYTCTPIIRIGTSIGDLQ